MPRRGWPRDRNGDLQALLQRPPHDFGRPTGLWTLALLASVRHEQGWTARALSGEAAGKPDWVLGFQDECWWTRLAQPGLSWWTGGEPLRLGSKARDAGPAAEREAVACYGVLRADTGGLMPRFVEGPR